jgi:hypothetical protein
VDDAALVGGVKACRRLGDQVEAEPRRASLPGGFDEALDDRLVGPGAALEAPDQVARRHRATEVRSM